MRMMLARHGPPAVDWRPSLTRGEYLDWIKSFDSSGIHRDVGPPAAVREFARSAVILTSTLKRAAQSASLLGEATETMAALNEVSLSPPHLPVRMTPSYWTAVSRLYWLICFRRARKASQAEATFLADLLMKKAMNQDVIVVGHGWRNRMIAKDLQRCGLRRSCKSGNGYWSYEVFVARHQRG